MSKNTKILISTGLNYGNGFYKKLEASGYKYKVCRSDAFELIDEIKSFVPDIVLCDVNMPGMDAVGVIDRVSEEMIRRPFFIVASPCRNPFMEKEVMMLEDAYYLLLPFDAEMLISLMARITAAADKPVISEGEAAQYEVAVTDVLHQMGIPAHIKGYHYLREAIMLSLNDNDMLDSITKLLYPTIARHFDTTSSRVERAIRHAIETAWDRGDVDVLNEMFGYTISVGKGKPTNSEFIALITDNLRLRFKITGRSSKRSERVRA